MSRERRTDKRCRPRAAASAELKTSDGEIRHGNLRDVSVGGAFVETPTMLPVGTELDVVTTLDGVGIECRSRIVWSRATAEVNGNLPAGFGVRWSERSPKWEPVIARMDDVEIYRAPSLADADTALVAAFRRELARAGFVEDMLARLASYGREFILAGPYLFESRDAASQHASGSLATLVALFHEGQAVPHAELERIFSPRVLELLFDTGLVAREGERVAATVTLVPWKGILVAADRFDRKVWDAVWQPNNGTGRMAACFPLLQPGDRVLDLGTGSGVLSLLLEHQGVRPIAVDPNPRALEFVALNAKLNDLPTPELVLGDQREIGANRSLQHIVFGAPSPTYDTPVMAAGHRDQEAGWKVIRDTYALIHDSLTSSGVAAIRHELLAEWLNEADFVDRIRPSENVEVLYLHVPLDDPHEIKFGLELSHGHQIVYGHALIRRRRNRAAPRVVFANFSFDEYVNYSAVLHWRRVLSVPGWEDVFSR